MLMSPLAFETDLLILTVDLHTAMSPIYRTRTYIPHNLRNQTHNASGASSGEAAVAVRY